MRDTDKNDSIKGSGSFRWGEQSTNSTLENCLAISYEVEHTAPLWSSNSKRNKNTKIYVQMFIAAFFYNNPKLQTPHTSTDRAMYEQIVVNQYNETPLNNKKKNCTQHWAERIRPKQMKGSTTQQAKPIYCDINHQ
jgi:hypothetical protein